MNPLRLPQEPEFQALLEREPVVFSSFTANARNNCLMVVVVAVSILVVATIVAIRLLEGSLRASPELFLSIALVSIGVAGVMGTQVRFRLRARTVRHASYLACPNCLFDLSDLIEPTNCPECGFDVRYLDLPAAWKALFRWSIRGLASDEDMY